MSQSKKHSLYEQVLDKVVGFITSLMIWSWLIAPAMGYNTTWDKNIWVTVIFTVWSIMRGYGTRRLFNWLHTRGYL